MTSHRRRTWQGRYNPPHYHIEHFCPACDKYIDEPTDNEWRPEGEELNLGTHGGIE